MSLSKSIYNLFFKRNSIMVGTALAGAFLFETTFDEGMTLWWESRNSGKLWKDIKKNYVEAADEDDDE